MPLSETTGSMVSHHIQPQKDYFIDLQRKLKALVEILLSLRTGKAPSLPANASSTDNQVSSTPIQGRGLLQKVCGSQKIQPTSATTPAMMRLSELMLNDVGNRSALPEAAQSSVSAK